MTQKKLSNEMRGNMSVMTTIFMENRRIGLAVRQETLDVEVVIPVFNEELALESSIRQLHAYLVDEFPLTAVITVVDNGSKDGTWQIARRLEIELPFVQALHLERKGRGFALRSAWSRSQAQVVAYMDVDLSTGLDALFPLVAPLLSGHSDLAIGTRLARSAQVERSTKRELISRGYNSLLRQLLRVGFSDAQCGFKAIRSDRACALLPLVENNNWFFDTELLVLAERAGMRIHEIPVDWIEDTDSRVDIRTTAVEDLKGMLRLVYSLGTGRIPLPQGLDRNLGRSWHRLDGLFAQMIRFASVGVASTLFYFTLYLALRLVAPPLLSNALALLISAVANTAANRWFTFGIRGNQKVWLHQTQGLLVFGVGLALTSSSLAILAQVMPDAPRLVEVGVLVLANVLVTLTRFALFRGWVFREVA
jgi:glycosyltransferase involved in cell wall biosynthesis